MVFDTVVHWGTLVAVLAFFWRDWLTLIVAWLRSLVRWDWQDPQARLMWLLIAGSVPAAVIGFVLEDRTTQEMDGILPDSRLREVWWDHPFEGEPKYDPALSPFFLRLMEKYDVSYRLPDGTASLVAQHVPQVRPALPWLSEQTPLADLRREASKKQE